MCGRCRYLQSFAQTYKKPVEQYFDTSDTGEGNSDPSWTQTELFILHRLTTIVEVTIESFPGRRSRLEDSVNETLRSQVNRTLFQVDGASVVHPSGLSVSRTLRGLCTYVCGGRQTF